MTTKPLTQAELETKLIKQNQRLTSDLSNLEFYLANKSEALFALLETEEKLKEKIATCKIDIARRDRKIEYQAIKIKNLIKIGKKISSHNYCSYCGEEIK